MYVCVCVWMYTTCLFGLPPVLLLLFLFVFIYFFKFIFLLPPHGGSLFFSCVYINIYACMCVFMWYVFSFVFPPLLPSSSAAFFSFFYSVPFCFCFCSIASF
ncbi:hypothetical protein TCDM_04166 [Trypanosoma cruzi Dm28c]|uniref:Uncharacterized protein n=1 Tax=Trypanosoma cruzi Dm28c TaxID=1416333 RepID=V5B1T7_TRYCR|nr:hypothetical protein TCDM_04166 [Trypanosoma cruzi Dm28c]